MVAACVLLERALTATPKLRTSVFRPTAIVVIRLPSAEWSSVVEQAWYAMDPGVGVVEMRERAGHQHPKGETDARPRRYAMSRTDPRSGRAPEADAYVVRRAVARGEGIVALSQAPEECLSPDLIRVADHRITIPSLTGDDLTLVASRLTGTTPTKVFPPELLPGLELADLWLATRPRQKADAWLERLKRLVTAKAGKRPPLSARSPTLDSMHGMGTALAWGRSLAEDLSAYRAGRLGWDAVDRGAVLHGPPGTGKSAFAKALAATCDVPLITASHAAWQSSKGGHLGDMLSAMRQSFDRARRAAPCILLLDELDSFPVRADLDDRYRDYTIAVVNGLLEQLDGAVSREGVVVVGTTNALDRIDPAILRAGRMDVTIEVPLPGVQALARILRDRLGSGLTDDDLRRVAALRPEATGADAERWARGAQRRARRDGDRRMCFGDLWSEVRSGRLEIDRATMDRIAIHEAGHALMSVLGAPGTLVSVTMLSQGTYLGRTTCGLGEAPLLLTGAQLDVRLQYTLAGRVAEEVYFGEASSGAGGEAESDLARATLLATMAEAQYCLGTDQQDLLWLGPTHASKLTDLFARRPDLEQRVRARLASAYAFVRHQFTPLLALLTELAKRLLQQETLDGAAVEAFIHAELANVHLGASGQSTLPTTRYLRPSGQDAPEDHEAASRLSPVEV